MVRTTEAERNDAAEREALLDALPWYIRAVAGQGALGFKAGDTNLYRYVGNSPTNATDPSGLYLIITEGEKAKPVELFFGKDNVEYEPIPAKPGYFKVKLKPGAALHLENYVKDADDKIKAYAAWLFVKADSDSEGLTLEQLAKQWGDVLRAGPSRPMTAEQYRAWYKKYCADNPTGPSVFGGQNPMKPLPNWDDLTPEQRARMRLLIYGKLLSLPVTK